MRRVVSGVTWLVAGYLLILVACLATLALHGDLTFGRNPWSNLARTMGDFLHPSFLDAWSGPERLEFKADDGRVLRVENRRESEQAYLGSIAAAAWITVVIGTLGSALAALLALPLGFVAARNAGVVCARGALVAFLDSDDIWGPTHLADAVSLLEADPTLQVSYSGATFIDQAGRPTGHSRGAR